MSQPGSAETSTAVAQPTVTYVQTVPSSTVYVIPDTQTYQYYNNYYPYYGYYPYYSGWYYPPVSFSFGFGGGYHGGYTTAVTMVATTAITVVVITAVAGITRMSREHWTAGAR